ncbi:MAG: hypothetical protein ACPHSE_00710 [Flavobacteriaceae bacterium]
MKKTLLFLFVGLLSFSSYANTIKVDFEDLKKLEGKWIGTLNRTDGTSDILNLEYSITSNGSAILEESNTGGIEMLSIFNAQNNEVVLTHYCGLQNKPVSTLENLTNGVYVFKTDAKRSGLKKGKDMFVDNWKIQTMPEDSDKIIYEYTVIGPDGKGFTAVAEMQRVQ